MDLLDSCAPPEYAMQCISWSVEHEEVDALEGHIRLHKEKLKDELMYVLLDTLSKRRTRVVRKMLSILDQELRTVYNEGEKSWLQKLFISATEHGDTETVRDLIGKGANVDATCYGKPVLHLAACYDYSDIVNELIKVGSNVNSIDSRGEGIIHSVLTSQLARKDKMVRQVLDLGADPLFKSSSGKLPIHIAAKNSPDVLAMFIQDGQDVNIPDDVNKDTPLHIACGAACPETILTLIQGGCRFNTENVQGQTPLAKLLRFTVKDHDFHAKTRLNIAKRLLSIGFRMHRQNHRASAHSKGRDKCYDRYMSLRIAIGTPPGLQNLARLTVRESLRTDISLRKEIDKLDIPHNLKSFILCYDFKV